MQKGHYEGGTRVSSKVAHCNGGAYPRRLGGTTSDRGKAMSSTQIVGKRHDRQVEQRSLILSRFERLNTAYSADAREEQRQPSRAEP
jgi:hypothetical protein